MMHKSGQMESQVHKNIVRNKVEMFSYNLIATALSIDSLKHICNIKWEDYTNDQEKEMVKEALRIQQVIKNRNFVEFFRTLRRPTTNYFFACVMLFYMDSMRLDAIKAFARSYVQTGMPFGLVKTKLNMTSE